MKDTFGRKESVLDKLQRKAWADEAEKQALLAALAQEGGLPASMLIPLLASDDALVKERAGSVFLGRADSASITMLLQEAVGAEEPGRTALVKVLDRAKPEHVAEAITDSLTEPAKERRWLAWEVAFEMRPDHTARLLERALVEGPPSVRAKGLERIVGSRGAEASKAELIKHASDGDARVRKVALAALGGLSGADVFEIMLDRLGAEDDAAVRDISVRYLQKSVASAPRELRSQILGRLLMTGDVKAQTGMLTSLMAAGNVGEILLDVLTFSKSLFGAQQTAVIDALHAVGDKLVPECVKLLTHTDPDLRVQALLLLGHFRGPTSVSAAAKMLGDEDWWVRLTACDVLGRLKDERTLPLLERLLSDADARWAAIDALGDIGGEAALASLTRCLKDTDQDVRLAAVGALSKVKDPRVDALLDDVTKNDPIIENRIRAIELLRERRGNATSGTKAAVANAQLERPLDKLLAFARESGASDLHLSPDEPPILRINGALVRMKSPPSLSSGQVMALLRDILDPVREPILRERGAVDFCYSVSGVGRYRANVFTQKRGNSAAFRTIPNVPPQLTDLGLPKRLEEITTFHQGIVLLTGPASSGKSTSLAALVNVINESRNAHVLMLEDPIEFLHASKRALINQREIGRDSRSFEAAMRGALREDPDVIVVGEMRDPESIRLALLAAETGHLVIASMQTTGAIATIDKLVESFPVDEQSMVRGALAGSLKLIVSQKLVPRADGRGRVAVLEILKSTTAVRALIREGRTFQLPSAMTVGRGDGMLTTDMHLEELVAAGTISLETAYAIATKKDLFTKRATPTRLDEKQP